MPNIEQYTATGEITPSDKGIQAAEVAGRRLGMYGQQGKQDLQQIGAQVKQHEDDMWQSHFYVATTSTEANLQTGWDTFVSDPAHKDLVASGTAASAYMDQVAKPTLQALTDAAGSDPGRQRMAQEEASRLQSNLFTKVSGEQSALTGAVFAQNFQQTQNNLSASALQDPSDTNVNEQLALNDRFVAGLPDAVQGEGRIHTMALQTAGDQRIAMSAYNGQIEAVRQKYAQAASATAAGDTAGAAAFTQQAVAAEGAIRTNIAGQKWFQYLGGTEEGGGLADTLSSRVDETVRSGQDQIKVGAASAKENTETNVDAQLAQIRGSLLPDANGQPPDPGVAASALAKLHALTQSSDPVVAARAGKEAEAIGGVIKTQAEDRLTGKFTPDDPSALSEINQRISIAPGSPGALSKVDLDNLRIQHRISDATYEQQTKRLDDMTNNPLLGKTEEQLKGFMQTSIWPQIEHGASPTADATGVVNLFGSTVDPKGRAAAGIALNDAMGQFELMVHNGMAPDAAYKVLTDPGNPGSLWHVVPHWQNVAANGPGWAAQHPISPNGSPPPVANADLSRIQTTGPIKPGESWTAYKARAGIQ